MRLAVLSTLSAAGVFLLTVPAEAVLLYRSATRNTTAPTGVYANSGWELQANYGAFAATPIGPNHLLTARHLGGQQVRFQGVPYTRAGIIDVPGTDLRIIAVAETLPTWATLYDPAVDGSPVGKNLVVFGHGTPRGAPIYGGNLPPVLLDSPIDPGLQPLDEPVSSTNAIPRSPAQDDVEVKTRLLGYAWELPDYVQAWGTNTVDAILDTTIGSLLTFDFDPDGTPHEAHLSGGDSGGAVFIQTSSGWKLAAINYSVDGPFRVSPTSPEFLAALTDARGLYFGDPPQVINGFDPVTTSAYSTYIPTYRGTINSVIGASLTSVPEPASLAALAVLPLMAGRRRR